jgi:hypothetical protein
MALRLRRLRRRRLQDRAKNDPYERLRGDYDLDKLRAFFSKRPAALSIRCVRARRCPVAVTSPREWLPALFTLLHGSTTAPPRPSIDLPKETIESGLAALLWAERCGLT